MPTPSRQQQLEALYEQLTARLFALDRDEALALPEYDRSIHLERRALVAAGQTEVLRLLAPVPSTLTNEQIDPWGASLAHALHTGLCQLYMLDGAEVGIDLEGLWPDRAGQSGLGLVALSFIGHSLGGAGYLPRAAGEFHRVAQRAM